MFGKYSNFFWGIINCLTYGAFAIAYSFGGDAQFKLFVSLPLQFFGLWKWNKSKEGSSVRSCSVFQMAILFIIGGGLASGLYYEIPIFTKSITGTYPYLVYQTPRILDSISTACNIIGMFLLVYECWQQYIFWLIVDSIQIAIYAGVGHFGLNINILMMWSVYWISCICGGIIWYRRYQTEKTANN
ncbi:MAG: nicotinamide mononucleotide transporter-domain-containing protein [Hyperionvirus sp.]|uniref:Nicotinamide mononucleotide transporter-domain-containing protein n=1 Tax=Hyperionvirus sp. TaxID=2487770 RepID=A0A3G5A5N3_9VIRU|nr:MAG: nicotinamide mononucleotide transporter-domain-containing protein [Hyperionvirus sp.]